MNSTLKLFIDYIDTDIRLSNKLINFNKGMIKRCIFICAFHFTLLIPLLLVGYYFDSFNWINGLAVGINFIMLGTNLWFWRDAKFEIGFQEIKIQMHEYLKKQLTYIPKQAADEIPHNKVD